MQTWQQMCEPEQGDHVMLRGIIYDHAVLDAEYEKNTVNFPKPWRQYFSSFV